MTHDPSDAFAHEVQRRAYGQRLEVFVGSRDAGHTLTYDGLKEGISLRRLIDTSRDLSEYADQAMAIVRDEYHPRLDCREGCSYCCRKPGVLVTVPELLRIIQHVHDTFDAETASAVRERARRYVQQLAGRSFDEPTDESVPCPLLSDERCAVYEIRPLTCRGYNSTSVDACRHAHESTNVLVPIFALIKDVTDGTTVGAAARLREIGFNHSLVDLGTALNIALEAGEGFSQAVIGGSDTLRPAENATWADALWTRVRETAQQVGVHIETETE
jgi:Fe-S-cluster containining protein